MLVPDVGKTVDDPHQETGPQQGGEAVLAAASPASHGDP